MLRFEDETQNQGFGFSRVRPKLCLRGTIFKACSFRKQIAKCDIQGDKSNNESNNKCTRYCMCGFLRDSEKLLVLQFLARFSEVLVFLFVVRISVDAGWAGTKSILFYNQPIEVSINH